MTVRIERDGPITTVTIDRPAVKPEPGMSILISLEPRGGAPGALPTGPVVFAGRLAATTGL